MDSTPYTLTMLGTGGSATQYLFLTLGLGAYTDEPGISTNPSVAVCVLNSMVGIPW